MLSAPRTLRFFFHIIKLKLDRKSSSNSNRFNSQSTQLTMSSIKDMIMAAIKEQVENVMTEALASSDEIDLVQVQILVFDNNMLNKNLCHVYT